MPRLGSEPTVHPASEVHRSTLGRYVEIDARCRLADVEMDDYSYLMQDGEVALARTRLVALVDACDAFVLSSLVESMTRRRRGADTALTRR